jgi:choline dehydrogenase-like flavoprotein
MRILPARITDVLGNGRLQRFDVCIVGSGAGGSSAAHVLTAAGKNVLVLEAGHNPWPRLDRADALPLPFHSNDELKYALRRYLEPQGLLEPRTFRTDPAATATLHDDVNALPKAVGGAFQHADGKSPRFNVVDFQLRSHVEETLGRTPGLAAPGFGADAGSANFADWPLDYAELEPFYVEAERLYGVQGADDNPFASWRSEPHPMPPGLPMYHALLLAEGARRTAFFGGALHPHAYPGAQNSTFYDGRPPCVDCGPCSGFGCPNNAKGSPAVTALRKALLTGRCQLRFNAHVMRLRNDGGHVQSLEYVDGDGRLRTATADAYVLAASAIESARLCLLSPTPNGDILGNASGQVGRNLTFHLQNLVNGFMPQRIHGQRGRAVTTGLSDFRGVEPGGERVRVFETGGAKTLALGGIIEFSASQGLSLTDDADVMLFQLPAASSRRYGIGLKNALRDAPISQHLVSLLMQGEDAPQRSNRVDLDPAVKDIFGLPVARITYRQHRFEVEARKFYLPVMRQILSQAGAERVFVAPCDTVREQPPTSRHVMGTLRMGTDPKASVLDAHGRFHDVDNLYACDGSVLPSASGWNPTLTIIAMALRIAHHMAGTRAGSATPRPVVG